MLLRELFEARKKPELNPKVSINQAIQQAKNQPNTFVSFTQVDKLGVNPRSSYDTPIGIYAYPIGYAFKEIGTSRSAEALPFAGDAEFANIFQARGNIVDLGSMTEAEMDDYCNRIDRYIKQIDLNLSNVVAIARRQAPKMALVPGSVGGRFWYVTMTAANDIGEATGSNMVVAWNKLFRSIGIDGCVDSKGEGIIHENEPTQAVFFSIQAITNVQRVYNRYSPYELDTGKHEGKQMLAAIEKFKQASSIGDYEKILQTYGDKAIQRIRDPKIRLQLIARNPYLIMVLPKPTYEEQLEALEQDFEGTIARLEKPNHDAVAQAFGQQATGERTKIILEVIPQPYTPALQLALVRYNPSLLLELTRPAKSTVEYVVRNSKRPWVQDFARQYGIEI